MQTINQERGDTAVTRSARHEGRKLAPTALLVAATLAVGSLIPIVRDALVAARLGATSAGDAYFLSTYIAVMLVTIFVAESSAPAAVVTLSSTAGGARPSRGLSLPVMLLLAGVALSVVAVSVTLAAEPIVRLLAPGFDARAVEAGADATIATAPAVTLLGMAWLVAAYLNATNRFVLPSLITPLVAIGACLPLLAGADSPARAAAGWSIGAGLALAVLLAGAIVERRADARPVVARLLDRERLAVAGAIAAPLLLLALVTQSTEIADRVIASNLRPGALTTVALAKKTIILPGTILAAAVGTVVLPFLSRRESRDEHTDAFGRTLNLSLFFLLPSAALIGLMRTNLVSLLYGRGEFGARDVRETAGLLGLYAIALVPTNIGVVLQRSFATLGASRTPLAPYAVAMGCYIPAAWLGSRAIGLQALPLAFTLAELAYVGTLLIALDRRLRFPLPSLLWPVGVSALATAGLAVAVLAVELLRIDGLWLDTGLKLAAGCGAYGALVIWLRHPAATDILAARRPVETAEPTSERVRVGLDLTYADGRDGTGRYVTSMARELERRPDVELLPFRAPHLTRLPRFVHMPLNGVLHVVWAQLIMPLWAWQRRVDVLHVCAIGPLHAPCPVVVTVYDALDFIPELRPSRVWSAYVRLLGVRAARRSQAILTGSRASAAEISAYYGIPVERLHVVPFGSDLPRSPATPPAAASAIPANYVLSVASATRRKNVETTVAAVERLRAAGRDVELVVAGSLPVTARHGRPWLHALKDVEDSELVWLYSHAQAVVVASLHEGFGLPIVEALSFGVPVVASDIAALREVGHDGPRFVPPLDADAFARQLAGILDDPGGERERIQSARLHVEGLTWARAAQSTSEVYRVLLTSANRGRAWLPTAVS